jgi:hypothetical protein
MFFAPVLAFVAFLYSMNTERSKQTPWGDCFLRALTRATAVYVVGCLIEGILFILWWAIVVR